MEAVIEVEYEDIEESLAKKDPQGAFWDNEDPAAQAEGHAQTMGHPNPGGLARLLTIFLTLPSLWSSSFGYGLAVMGDAGSGLGHILFGARAVHAFDGTRLIGNDVHGARVDFCTQRALHMAGNYP